MKKIVILVAVLGVGVLLYFLLFSNSTQQDDTEDEVSTNTAVTTSDNSVTRVGKEKKKIDDKKEPLKKVNLDGPMSQEEFNGKLDAIVSANKRELEECEMNVDRVFGNALEDENETIFKEDNILDVLDEFDMLTLTPKASGDLLKILAHESIKNLDPEELGNKLRDLRPCRPYKKMGFIHGLMSNYLKNKWSEETKKRAVQSVFKYFDKELQGDTTIANLNMQAALLQTMVSEGMLGKKHEEMVMDYKDDLEDAYDELLDRADEIKEAREEKGDKAQHIPLEVIRSEFKLAGKYRKGLVDIIKTIKRDYE
jgi:hypothetical protein